MKIDLQEFIEKCEATSAMEVAMSVAGQAGCILAMTQEEKDDIERQSGHNPEKLLDVTRNCFVEIMINVAKIQGLFDEFAVDSEMVGNFRDLVNGMYSAASELSREQHERINNEKGSAPRKGSFSGGLGEGGIPIWEGNPDK